MDFKKLKNKNIFLKEERHVTALDQAVGQEWVERYGSGVLGLGGMGLSAGCEERERERRKKRQWAHFEQLKKY